MSKRLMVCGVPGTGKSTLMKAFMKDYQWEYLEPKQLVKVHYCKELDLYVIGQYAEGEVFGGTDRLAMNAQPNVIEFIKSTGSNILFEGDRLTNGKMIDFLMNEADDVDSIFQIFVLTATGCLQDRYKERGSDQSETFLKGRETKINNILSNFDYMDYTLVYQNRNLDEQSVILNHMKAYFS